MIEESENRITYLGDGAATEFAIPFSFLEKEDIVVVTVSPESRTETLEKDYFVDADKKAVIYPGYPPGEDPPESERPPVLPAGWKLVIYRNIAVTQKSSLGSIWPFNLIEDGLDKLTMICQDILFSTKRMLKLPESIDEFDPTLPEDLNRSPSIKRGRVGEQRDRRKTRRMKRQTQRQRPLPVSRQRRRVRMQRKPVKTPHWNLRRRRKNQKTPRRARRKQRQFPKTQRRRARSTQNPVRKRRPHRKARQKTAKRQRRRVKPMLPDPKRARRHPRRRRRNHRSLPLHRPMRRRSPNSTPPHPKKTRQTPKRRQRIQRHESHR